MEPDGTWTGFRDTDDGNGGVFSKPGPGTWSLDGSTFTLMYADGSDTETYNTVRVGTHVEPDDGLTYRDMSLEIAYENGGCLVYLLDMPHMPVEGE